MIFLKLEDDEFVKLALAVALFVDDIDFSKYQLSSMNATNENAVFLDQVAQMIVHQKSIYAKIQVKCEIS